MPESTPPASLETADDSSIATGTGRLDDDLDLCPGVERVVDGVGGISKADEGVGEGVCVNRPGGAAEM